tara:strand:- start:10404 stop:13748 length:3345 start_codon:yes stop_codon:yes gene_type:complete
MPLIQNNSGGRLGSIGRAPEPTVDELLKAASAEGGVVGDTAERLMNPKKSFFSTMTDRTFRTLNGFIDTIQTPMYAVGGLLDPTRTMGEAIKEKVSPGDVLLQNKPSKSDPFINRAGYQVAKFGVDTLLDPLTYVTFGASRGIIGLSKGADAFAGRQLAEELGKREGMRVYLSESGEKLADDFLKAKRKGLRDTYLKNERVKMVNRGLDNDEITRRLAELDNTVDDYLIKETFETGMSKKQAAQAVANLGRYDNTRHLLGEFIDKGGIKFFGKSILSGQRIRKVNAMIPGMSALDKAMEPVRGYFGNYFSTNYAGGQRLTDEYIDVRNKWKNIYEAHRDRLSINGVRIKEQLGLTNEEWEFVSAAAEYGLRPADSKADDVWRMLHGEDPVSGAISENVWKGVTEVQKMNTIARGQLVASGIPVPDRPNYLPHLLVKEEVANVPFNPGVLKQNTNRTKFASFGVLKKLDGTRTPVQFKLDESDLGKMVVRFKDESGIFVEKTLTIADAEEELGKMGARQFLRDEETGELLERVRGAVDELNRAGFEGVEFESNALVASLLASDDAIRVSSARHFTQELAQKFGEPISKAPQGYVQVEKMGMQYKGRDLADFLVNKGGEPLLFPREIAEQIATFSSTIPKEEGLSQFMKMYDGLQNYFKAAVTSIFPAFHGRNALSNVFLAYNKIGLEALNPANHAVASKLMKMHYKTGALQKKMLSGKATTKEYTDLMRTPVFTDKTGYQWSWGELRTQIIDNVVAFHHKNLGQTDQLRFGMNEVREASRKMFPKSKADKIKSATDPLNPFNTDNLLFKSGFAVGQSIEDYSRTMLYLANLRKTGDPIMAARTTKLALFDYSNLTKFEKEFMRRIVPFYSFSRKNLELQFKTLLNTPGRTAQQIRAVQSLGDYFAQDSLSEEELDKLPEWAKKGYNVVSDREGSHITLMRTLGTPIEELFNRADPKENLGIVSPLIKAPIEFAAGYSFFHGRPISEVTQADAYQFAPDYIKDYIGYKEVKYTDQDGNEQSYYTSFAPWRMYTINNLQPVGRFFSEVNRIEKAPDATSKFNALMFGFGTREFDLEREELRRIKENEQALIDILEQGGVGYTFERYVPNQEPTLGER